MSGNQEAVQHSECRHGVCTWWKAYFFDNVLRRLAHNPAKLLGPYVQPGDHVTDLGCGMGFFSLGLARLVGENGGVTSVDLQPKMLDVLMARARRKGLESRITPVLCTPDRLNAPSGQHFALACWMVHEVPDKAGFFIQVHDMLEPGGRFLVAEPKFHVSEKELAFQKQAALAAGLVHLGTPRFSLSKAALYERPVI